MARLQLVAIAPKPIDRFGLDLQRIRFLDPMAANDEPFYVEQSRTVRKDIEQHSTSNIERR